MYKRAMCGLNNEGYNWAIYGHNCSPLVPDLCLFCYDSRGARDSKLEKKVAGK